MKQSRIIAGFATALVLGAAAPASAGAPQPETRQGDFAHVCRGGPNKTLPCTVPTQDVDCPKSECVVQTLSKPIKGTLTIVAHDTVTDWLNGGATNQALTVLLEVKAPGGVRHQLAATYQELAQPTLPPQAPTNVVSIGMDEQALATVGTAVSGLRFVQPETTLAAELQTLFGNAGTPVIIATKDRRAVVADHTGDALATVLRVPVKIQFLDPL